MQYLDGSAAGRDKRLHGGSVIASCELLLLSLPALHHGDGHQLLVHPRVQIQDLKHLFGGLLFGGESRVSLLPQELPGSQERLRVLELPSLKRKESLWRRKIVAGQDAPNCELRAETDHDVAPLVEFNWQVSVRLDPFSVGWVHNCNKKKR